MESKVIDLGKMVAEGLKKREKEIKYLESHSKELSDVVITEKFTVDEVIAQSYAKSFTPDSERVMGGISPVYKGGFTSRLIIQVSPDNQNVPVKTLNFEGISPIKTGDYISAQIPRYEERRVDNDHYFSGRRGYDIFYLDRDFNPEESAIELALLSEDGRVLRRDRSVKYQKFLKK